MHGLAVSNGWRQVVAVVMVAVVADGEEESSHNLHRVLKAWLERRLCEHLLR